MQGWQTPYLGQRHLPREFSQFELQAFFSFSATERELIARRRGDSLKLGLALHIGFVRMAGRPLNSVRVVPGVLQAHLSRELGIAAPDLASVRALYARGRTLFDHQQQACECLGFGWMTEHQRRALVRVLRDEVAQCADRERLLSHARQWLYDHKLLVLRDRDIRALAAAALVELERETAASISASAPASTIKRWSTALEQHSSRNGQHCQSWLWSAPAKHSTRQIAEVLERIARLQLPAKASDFLAPLLVRIRAGVEAVAAATRARALRVDDELHLAALAADDEDPEVTKLRSRLDRRIGEVQLPEVILAVDAQVRFSWIMLGREPRSGQELLMAYAGILAHGTSLTAAECARMIPQLSATSIRQAMRWAGDERRLALACQAVLEFMQRHAIAATWGRADLASSDMMSLETSRRVWQARQDPRRQTASVGI